jgi:hypothetical protein
LIALALNRKRITCKVSATKPRSKATGGEINRKHKSAVLQNELLYFNTSSKESKFIFRTNFRVIFQVNVVELLRNKDAG